MSDPHHTNPQPGRASRDPGPRPSSAPMWAWIAGIAVVVVVAFALAAGWSSNTDTASNAPPATMGSGGTTIPPATTGRGATGSSTTGSGATDVQPTIRQDEPATPAPNPGIR